MKKVSKKQKLIIAIAITLIVIILAIVFTTNIINNNSQIANEGYFATTTNANSNLIASYIKEGVKVGGITGTLEVLNTSDATATSADIAKGKTAYVNGVKITGTYLESTLGNATGNETENSYVHDKYGNQVVVPAGFKVVNPYDDVTKGIIIEDVSAGDKDTKGSQFVWIPVGDVITDSNGSKTTITLGRYTFDPTEAETLVQSAENWSQEVAISTYYKELATSSYGNATAKNLKDFVEKATTSKGYYIGRYEAGDALATTTSRINSTSDKNPIVCKAGVYPYNYVTQPQASSLARGMYSSSNFESDLINSYAWDTAIVFIQTFSEDGNYSRQIGINTASALQKCGESILKSVDSGDKAQDIRCNIYDMAGNTVEWTTETSFYQSLPSVRCGGYCDGSDYYTSYRDPGTLTGNSYRYSFRPTLYL